MAGLKSPVFFLLYHFSTLKHESIHPVINLAYLSMHNE